MRITFYLKLHLLQGDMIALYIQFTITCALTSFPVSQLRMKVAVVVALVALVVVASVAADPCPGPICDGGCCTQKDYICCKGEAYCAKPGNAHCKPVNEMISMLVPSPQLQVADVQSCPGTECPRGCCKEGKDWFCCPDGDYCAKTADGCPNFF